MTVQEIIKRDDVDLDVTVTDLDGVAINLTNQTVIFTMKNNPTDPDSSAVIQKRITSHTVPSQGKTRVVLTHDDTDIPAKYYFYDLQVISSVGKVSSIPKGQIRVIQDITVEAS